MIPKFRIFRSGSRKKLSGKKNRNSLALGGVIPVIPSRQTRGRIAEAMLSKKLHLGGGDWFAETMLVFKD